MPFVYMVSFQCLGGFSGCGNRCGTLEEVNQFARDNNRNWKSYSFFRFRELSYINVLTEVSSDGSGGIQCLKVM